MADHEQIQDVPASPEQEDPREYTGPEELLQAKELLESVMGGLGGLNEGRLMSAVDDILFVMEMFMMTKKEIAEMEAEEAQEGGDAN